jgi:hypothetical protein
MKKPLSIETSQLENVAQKTSEKQGLTKESKPSSIGKASKVISSSHENWKVPKFKESFNLEQETTRALHEARHYMNDILGYDDLYVEMDIQVLDVAQGHVKDKATGKLVNSYAGTDMLKLYSQNRKERGIIVDGRL